MRIALLSAQDAFTFTDITAALDREVIAWTLVHEPEELENATSGAYDILLIDMAGPYARAAAVREITTACHKDSYVPVFALVHSGQLDGIDLSLGVDDFVLVPADPAEIITRLALLNGRFHAVTNSADEISLGDLRINHARYEVWVGVRQVTLTFKEYELLRLLASQPGHVYTRHVLLDLVWGYDYFGGTRTVDVHVRRLRSKIEDQTHTFVETVRNVGYRLRADPGPRRIGQPG